VLLPVAPFGAAKPDQDGQSSRASGSSSRSGDGGSRNQQDEQSAKRQVEDGKKELDRQRYDKALEHLDLALKTIPHDLEVRILAARAARMFGEFTAAKKHLDACAKLPDPDGRLELARALLAAQTDVDFEARDWDVALIKKANDEGPDREAILEVLVVENLRVDRLMHAIENADKLLAIRADHRYALLWKGQALADMADKEGAIKVLQKALDVDAEFDLARAALVQAHLVNNNPTNALEHAKILHKHRPDDSQAMLSVARCNRMLGEAGNAVPLLDEALAKRPRDMSLVIERALAGYQLEPRTKESEQWLRKAYKLAPKNREILFSLCRCLRQRGVDKADTAVAAAGAAGGAVGFQGYVENTDYGALERILDKMEQQGMEFFRVQRKLSKDEKNLTLRLEAARLAGEIGLDKQALQLLKQGLTLAPDDPKVHQALADYYENMGDLLMYRYHRRRAGPAKP
jgi:tetratricopeptide (TPR) repeat protein